MIHVTGIAREYLERLRARASLDQSQQAIRLTSEVARCFGTAVLDVASESGREKLVLRRSTRTSGRSLGALNGGSWSSSRV